jgi:hypothetical protein
MAASKLRIQSLLKQINLLNGILLTGILAFGYFVLWPIFTGDIKVPLSPAAAKVSEQKKVEPAEQPANPPLQEYAVVAEKNLFHPDRIIPAKKDEIAVPRPEFALYGTLITDKISIAYISDSKAPRTTPGRGERQTGLKIGETMSGYTLKEVLHDHVVMVHGDDRIEVTIVAHDNKKKRSATETATQKPAQAPMPQPATGIPGQTSLSGGIPAAQPNTGLPLPVRRGIRR